MRRRTVLSMASLAAAAILTPVTACSTSDGETGPASTSNQSSSAATGDAQGAPYTVRTQELSFESAGNNIYGEVMIPDVEGPAPAVIMSHGFGGNHAQEPRLQELLAQHGVVVHRFDFAGGSGYEPGRSEGDMRDMSVLTEEQNLRDALAQVQSLDYVDARRIHLIGASQGGVVSTLVADEDPDAIRGLILLYPALSLFDDVHERFPAESDIPDSYDLMGLTVGRRYAADVYDMDIYEYMSNVGGRVMIFHGTADDLVPITYSERAAETFQDATLTRLEGEGHGFSTAAQERVATAVLDMIQA